MKKQLPKDFTLSNRYNIPIHDQGNKNSCVLHALAAILESYLSEQFDELTLIDVDGWWEDMLQKGMAVPEGTNIELAMDYISRYGVKYTTKSGNTGIFQTYFQEGSIAEILNEHN